MSITQVDADRMIEMIMPIYPGLDITPERHCAMAAEIFGALLPGESAEKQMADMGMVMGVLLWKLAQARGLIAQPVQHSDTC